MARTPLQGADQVYEAAEQWVQRCLATEGSLFTDGESVWTHAHFEELRARFIDERIEGATSFMDKLHTQLESADDPTVQLMAEVLYVHLLATVNVAPATKRSHLDRVRSWMRQPASVPDELDRALEHGLVKPGQRYSTRRDQAISWLIEFGCHWTAETRERREQLRADPFDFKKFLHGLPPHSAYAQRNVVAHLVFPDTFEAIASAEDKSLIVDAFSQHLSDSSDDVDEQLLQIREALTPEFGPAFNFYDQSIKVRWKAGKGTWKDLVPWAQRFYDWPGYSALERDHKVDVADALAAARQKFLGETDGWASEVADALSRGGHTLIEPSAIRAFRTWLTKDPNDAEAALSAIWGDGSCSTDAIETFTGLLPVSVVSGTAARLGLASLLLSACDPTTYVVYRPEHFTLAYKLTDTPEPAKNATAHAVYVHALELLDAFMEEAANQGLELGDRLDAESLLWAVALRDPLDSWPEEDRQAFVEFRGDPIDLATSPRSRPRRSGTTTDPEESDMDTLASQLYLDAEFLHRIERLLRSKGQIIFHGPPGTGKTYVARKFAEHLAGDPSQVELVQFHPSYAYEDFIEGYRPAPGGGFDLRPGPLRRIAESARENSEATYVLLIDELNRGNVAKVFGELYFLLEYRDETISLQYSDDRFKLPKNLLIIGTMNTADRSIAMVDGALRRRFFFVGLFPDEPPIDRLLERWLADHKPGMAWVADVLRAANRELGSRHLAVGPSHFLRNDLDDAWMQLIWDHSVLPYIEEQLFGEEERLEAFRLDRLRGVASAKTVSDDPTPSGGDEPAAEVPASDDATATDDTDGEGES